MAARASMSLRIDACPSGDDPSTAGVAKIGAGIDRPPQLSGLADLVGLEGQAQVGVDLVEAVRAEEREKVGAQSPEVVRTRAGRDALVAKHSVGLGLQPVGRVLVEGRHRARRGRSVRRDARVLRLSAPNTRANAREDVAELAARGA